MGMKVAPHEACTSCMRGDTDTLVFAEGDLEFLIVALHKTTGVSTREAESMIKIGEPEELENGELRIGIRLCRTCARRRSVPVATLGSGEVPVYRQSEMFPDG